MNKYINHLIVLLATIVMFQVCRNYAVIERGSQAIGSEIFVFLLPLFYIVYTKEKTASARTSRVAAKKNILSKY